MKCPKCTNKISAFSKSVNNFDKERKCPSCGELFQLKINYIKFFVTCLILVSIPVFILNGIEKNIAVGISVGIALFFSMEALELKNT